MKFEKESVGNYVNLKVRLVSIEPYTVEIDGSIISNPYQEKFHVAVSSEKLSHNA